MIRITFLVCCISLLLFLSSRGRCLPSCLLIDLLVLLQDLEYFTHLIPHMLHEGNGFGHLMQLLVELALSRRVIDHYELGHRHPIYVHWAFE